MFVQVLLAIVVGCVLGTLTGLVPGIHINLVATVMISVNLLEAHTTPLVLAVIIVAMAVTHTFLNFIPAAFMSIPDADTVLSTLPAYEYLKKGKVHEAVILTVMGSLFSLLIILICVPLLVLVIAHVYAFLGKFMGLILLETSLFLILREKGSRMLAFVIFLLAGILGVIVLDMNMQNPLLPLFSGLFGLPMLVLNLNKTVKIPAQRITFPTLHVKDSLKALFTAVCSGALFSLLPGMGPSQAAVIGSQVIKITRKSILILLGGINTVSMVVSFVTLYTIQKARNGAVATIAEIMVSINMETLWLFLASSLVAAFIATVITIGVSRIFAKVMTRVNYKMLIVCIVMLITVLVGVLSGIIGLLVLITATCIGIIPNVKRIHRNHLMGCLLLPVMLFFLL